MRYEMTGVQAEGRQVSEVLATKVCPQCGQVLFEDMDVCYGCLHDFRREVDVGSLGLPATLLERIEPRSGLTEDEGTGARAPETQVDPLNREDKGRGLALRVCSQDVELTVPLAHDGVMVGRLSSNDVVLRARSVSRHHVLIVPRGHEAQVIDQGATNPALLDGVEVTSSVAMGLGNVLDVCGVTFRLVKDGGGVTNVS